MATDPVTPAGSNPSGAAIYNRFTLAFYDLVVLGISNRYTSAFSEYQVEQHGQVALFAARGPRF